MEQEHTIEFKTEMGEVKITTPDINAISKVAWIKEFLGVSKETTQPDSSFVNEIEAKFAELIKHQNNLHDNLDKVTQSLNQVIRVQKQERALRLEQESGSAPSQAQSPKQPMPATKQSMQVTESDSEPDVQSMNVMDVAPNKMSDSIWNSMSTEQQEQWKQKHVQ